jgi:hypothetical protein
MHSNWEYLCKTLAGCGGDNKQKTEDETREEKEEGVGPLHTGVEGLNLFPRSFTL